MDTPFLVTNLKLPGESYDLQACYSKRDEHFDCMDRYKSVAGEENHYNCKRTLNSWRDACDPAIWRVQLEDRESFMRDNYLYSRQQLSSYNKAKNDMSYRIDNNPRLSQGKI